MPVMLRRLLLRENVQGYLFISPWLIGVLVFFIGPMVASLVLSLTDYSIIAPGLNFLGVENSDFLTWCAAVLPESQNSAVFEPLLG